MSKNFLERMRNMIASGNSGHDRGAEPESERYLQVEDLPLTTLQDFMLRSTHDGIAIARNKDMPHVQDASIHQGYLAGQLLVATPLIDAGCFQKSVIYMFAHNDSGAMGVMINQPLDLVQFSSLVEGFDKQKTGAQMDMPVMFGGPVDRHRGFVLHSADYLRDHTLMRHGEVAISSSNAILHDIAEGKGPAHACLCVGFAGWSAGQIEQEIEQNSWIHVPASAELIFDTPSEMRWVKASKSLGVDMNFFSTTVGHA